MTDFSDFTDQIKDWTNRQDFSDALVVSLVRQAEQKLNAELRIDRMIQYVENTVTGRCADLPDDWLLADFVSIENENGANGFLPIRYLPRDQFFNTTDDWAYGYFCIEGRTMTFGGPPDAVNGVTFRMAYYAEVPVFADDTDSWVYTKYPSLYLNAALYHAALHAVGEEQSAANFKQLAEGQIVQLNSQHHLSKASGSRLKRSRPRTFG